MKLPLLPLLACLLALSTDAHAFCGFYVAKADTKLFNHASKVVLARKGDKTVLTMVNDFEGDAKDFAVVIPVPTFLEKGQIHVGNQATVEHLDAYSAPRLVEYWDEDPCRPMVEYSMATGHPRGPRWAVPADKDERAKALGVKIEAQYTVGEYDIVILSAEQSDGLETWLTESGYKIPAGAADVLDGYIKQKMHFFVAKVNLEEKAKARLQFPAPDPGRLRKPEVHAAHPPGHGQRRRAAGIIRLRADRERPDRDDELPYGQTAHRHGRAALRQGHVRGLLPGDVRVVRSRKKT